MKRTVRTLLAAVLAAALALPAAAAAPTDQRMTQVTLSVKEQLEIGDSYTTFYGELMETEFRTCWILNWEGEEAILQVIAGEDGTIYSYEYTPQNRQTSPEGAPAFPSISREEGLSCAQDFVDQVLHQPEGATLTAESQFSSVEALSIHYQGQLELYGLSTPISLWVDVDNRDGTVLSYQRNDLYQTYLGQPEAPTGYHNVPEQASPLLKNTLALKLEYVADESHPDRAVLRYVPAEGDTFYVDAHTGELVNLTQLYDQLAAKDESTSAPGAGESASSDAVTDVEQEGIAQMAGVWDKAKLDSQARTFQALKLEGWSLQNCSYRLDQESGQVSAVLRYQRADTPSRTVTLDGKTGALLGASGWAWMEEDSQPAVSQEQAQKTAEEFLAQVWGAQWELCALYDSTPAESGSRLHTFTYAQQVNGYFFPANSITVEVDSADGAILSLSRSFDLSPQFDPPTGLISRERALDAWFETYQVELHYIEVPQRLERYGAAYQELMDIGHTWLMELRLGCDLTQTTDAVGIDAKTGQPVVLPSSLPDSPAYFDLEGSWGKEKAETLAEYGIGWLGDNLEPAKALTQLDLMALMASTQGYLADLSQEREVEQVYDIAISMDLLERSQRQDDKPITRAELTQVLLDYGGYGNAAAIPGIFRCTFTDEASIPAEYYGYAAIAQGLGVVSGDGQGRFAPNRTATRLEAVAMLYQFLAR